VIQRVKAVSEEPVRLRPGTLYGALDRLLAEGQVAVDREEVVGGRLRRYYRLTDQGVGLLAAEAARLRTTSKRPSVSPPAAAAPRPDA